MFDAMTGQLVNPGSPAFFVVVFFVVVVGLVVWKKLSPDKFAEVLAKAKAEIAEIEARIRESGPEFKAKLEADLAAAKARVDALLK
jgi:hypothetical protein